MVDSYKMAVNALCGLLSVTGAFFKPGPTIQSSVKFIAPNPEYSHLALGVMFFFTSQGCEINPFLNDLIAAECHTANRQHAVFNQFSIGQLSTQLPYLNLLNELELERAEFPSLRETLLRDLQNGIDPKHWSVLQAIQWWSMYKSPNGFFIDSYDADGLQGDFLQYRLGMPAGFDIHHNGFFHKMPVLIDAAGVFGSPSGDNRIPVTANTQRVMMVFYSFFGHENLALEMANVAKSLTKEAAANITQSLILSGFPVCFSANPAANHQLNGFFTLDNAWG